MRNKIIIGIVIAVLVGTVLGYTLSHKVSLGTISPAGTTNTSGKYYSQTFSLATASATTTSILNASGFDLAVRAVDVMCQGMGSSKTAYTGAGLANLIIKIATSSTNAITKDVADVNTNYLANITIGTTTLDSYQASSTEGIIPSTTRIIPNGAYAIISSNATNTAACSVGLSVMSL